MADVPHYCSACGEVHGGGSGETEAVKIAKINAETEKHRADRELDIARLARAEARQAIEAETEQTETIAEAEVEQTAIEAEAIVEAGISGTEPEVPVVEAPVVVEAPEEPAEEIPAPPETEGKSPERKSGGLWAGYR